MSIHAHEDSKFFEDIRLFMGEVATGGPIQNALFAFCVKASAVKCYEYNIHVRRGSESASAFFSIPSLRGICEDLIILRFVQTMAEADRESLIELLMFRDLNFQAHSQEAFFRAVRPHQSILRAKDALAHVAKLDQEIKAIWKRYGMTKFQRHMPQTREVAAAQGESVLGSLYEYLYRLTSAGVHFSVHSLLRSGWGPTADQFVGSTGF